MGEIQHLVKDQEYIWNNNRWIRYNFYFPITSIVDITGNNVLIHKDKRQHLPNRLIIFFPNSNEEFRSNLHQIIKPYVSNNYTYANAPYYFDYEGDKNLSCYAASQLTLLVTGIELDNFCQTCRVLGKVINVR